MIMSHTTAYKIVIYLPWQGIDYMPRLESREEYEAMKAFLAPRSASANIALDYFAVDPRHQAAFEDFVGKLSTKSIGGTS